MLFFEVKKIIIRINVKQDRLKETTTEKNIVTGTDRFMTTQNSPIFITIGNRKGGVGKTTSVINLASYLALLGKRVLIVDTDPQSNCSSILLDDTSGRPSLSLVDALEAPHGEIMLSDVVADTFHPQIQIIPNSARSTLWERKIATKSDAVLGIKRLLSIDPAINEYEFVLFDTPPNLGVMMNNALMASDYVIIPIPPSDQFALDGFAAYLDLIQSLRKYNKGLRLLAALVTKYDPCWGNSKENLSQIQKYFAHRKLSIFNTHIHSCPEIDMAHISRKTIFDSYPESVGATEYAALGRELLTILNAIHGKFFI